MGKAHHAVQQLKVLFDRNPAIVTWSNDGQPVKEVDGSIELRDVHL